MDDGFSHDLRVGVAFHRRARRLFASGKSKGNSSLGLLLGALLGFIGWILILILPEGGDLKCPDCFGRVPFGARKCKHCGSDIRDAFARADAGKAAARRGPTMEQASFTKCPCRRCGNFIEFDLTQFDRHNPPSIDCPHCGEQTALFVNR
jgi:ribosomal protein L40E